MTRYGTWEVIKELGGGGQGNVYLAKDTQRADSTEGRLEDIKKDISRLASMQTHHTQVEMGKLIVEAIDCLASKHVDASALGAVKVLHQPRVKEGYEKAKERMKREVEALSRITHPNILKIYDCNTEEGWFVGEYHHRGPLSHQQSLFQADMLRALEAFYPLVEGVAMLHSNGIVHRDIKPQNVFLSTDTRLVLGDLGIVFFSDSARTRITDSYESVGSTDWMPQWAMGMRIEEVRPTFDVFSLGKLLWSMLSGRNFLRLWYLHDTQFELERMFPRDESILWARTILDKCIVEHETDCLQDAGRLLVLVSDALGAVKRHAQVVANGVLRRCEICSLGQYESIADENQAAIRNFGLGPTGSSTFKVFTCSHCGHVQIFHIPNPQSKPRAWKRS